MSNPEIHELRFRISIDAEQPVYENDFSTTFWSDFSIADVFGVEAIKDTYNRCFAEWKDDIRYMTDLSIVLNHKSWMHDALQNIALSDLYSNLWRKLHSWVYETFKGDDIDYYFTYTD